MSVTAADWWLVGISALAALATAAAAVSFAFSARAARDTVKLLKSEADTERLRRGIEPMQKIRSLLGEYTITVPDGGQERADAKALQRKVAVELKRAGLEAQLPHAKAFADSYEDEVALSIKAFDEIQRVIEETTDEGKAFH